MFASRPFLPPAVMLNQLKTCSCHLSLVELSESKGEGRGKRESKKYIEQFYIKMSFLHSHLLIGIGDSQLFFFPFYI